MTLKRDVDRRRKLTAEDVELMRQLRRDLGYKHRELAEMFGTSEGNVSHILSGKSWSEPRAKRKPVGPRTPYGRHKTCTIKENGVRCTRKHRAKGRCHMHYRRDRKAGLI